MLTKRREATRHRGSPTSRSGKPAVSGVDRISRTHLQISHFNSVSEKSRPITDKKAPFDQRGTFSVSPVLCDHSLDALLSPHARDPPTRTSLVNRLSRDAEMSYFFLCFARMWPHSCKFRLHKLTTLTMTFTLKMYKH